MIKILHYCWFGGSPLPSQAIKYMDSWKKFCPEFKIKRWDETNFDIESVRFVAQAYKEKKWAFVSDYVRTYALFHEGGLYVDTDVEFIRSIDDLTFTSFMGFETCQYVNPGLVLYAANPYLNIYSKILERYEKTEFNSDLLTHITSPVIYTEVLQEMGLKLNNTLQRIDNITIYPTEFFQPLGSVFGGKDNFTNNTRTIHHYDASWFSAADKQYFELRKKYGKVRGRLIFIISHPKMALKKLLDKIK